MKKMRMMLVVAMLAMVTAVSAQMNLGIKGGVNMSNFYGEELDDQNMKIGFHVGLAADFDFAYNSAIQTGLYFTTKGAEYSSTFEDVSGEFTVNPMYLQLPVHYAYKLDVTPGTRIVFHGGPYAAYGVGGKSKFSASVGDLGGEGEADVFGDDGFLKRFDAGLGLGVGAELGPILLDLGWDMGLINIVDSEDGDLKNQNAYLSIGYRF
ncbi:MAG TPA: PorT family protein [Clostridiaceae bacterium]|nr:PorT family protein [Clostridiaceae bacterium]